MMRIETAETAKREPYAAVTISYDIFPGRIEITGRRQVGGYHVGRLRQDGKVLEEGLMGWGPYEVVMCYEDEDGADAFFLVELGGTGDTTMTTPTPTTAARFGVGLAQLTDDDLPTVAAALEAVGRQGDPALTNADAYLLIRGERGMVERAEFAIRPGEGGGFTVTVYAGQAPDLGGDGAVSAVVSFGPGEDAAAALAALLAAIHTAHVSRGPAAPFPVTT
jgi:hypothetical protein